MRRSAFRYSPFVCLVPFLWAISSPLVVRADEPRTTATLEFSEKVVAGGPSDFLEVRHIVMRGTNFDIGRKLADIARQRHGVTAQQTEDKLKTRAQREYFKRNYPIHLERMRGAAATFGVDLVSDERNLSTLMYGITLPGCSVVYYPPALTSDGQGVLSRNYDFTTGTFAGRIPESTEKACTSQPYILETYPDEGYASLAVVAYDLLGSVLDGINSEGLTVALLTDDEIAELGKEDPSKGTQAGLEVIQVTRFLLDTCANVDEAKVALNSSKLYYGVIPCHYIVADATGRAFIWENAPSMHYAHVFDAGSAPLITTNFMHYLHPEARDSAMAKEPFKTCNRYQALRDKTSTGGKFTLDEIKANNASVMFRRPAPAPPRAPNRTLWNSTYIPEQRRMEVDFYLGETPGKTPDAPPDIRRSGYLSFRLGSSK